MLIGNPFSNAPNPGIPGNVHTPQPTIPGTAQDGTRSRSGVTPGDDDRTPQLGEDEELDESGKVVKKKKAGDKGSELEVDFDKLWENEPRGENDEPDPDSQPYLPKIDPKQLAQTIGKMDFKKSIKPEQMQAIIAGGEGGAAAMIDIMENTARQTLLTAFTSANKLFESGITNAVGRVNGKMGSRINEVLASNNLSKSNTLAKNPAFAPIVEAVRSQVQTKYPKLNANQVEDAVNRMFAKMVETATAKPGKSSGEEEEENAKLLKKGAPNADWETWFAEELGQTK